MLALKKQRNSDKVPTFNFHLKSIDYVQATVNAEVIFKLIESNTVILQHALLLHRPA